MNELPGVRAFLGFLILTAMVVVGVAWLPLDLTIDRLLYEDFFYYLQVATHISRGHGATLDGVAPTNGFHPLWMLATTLAVQMGGREIAPHLMLSIAGLLHVCQAAMIFFLLRPLTSKSAAVLAAIFFATNYRLLACNMSGLETPLQGVLVLSIFGLLGPWRPRPSWTTSMATGAVLGLSVLARFDLLLLAAAATVWLVLTPRDNEPVIRRLMFACAVGCVAVVVLVPWFVWSQAHSGSWLPNSKKALDLWLFDPPHLDRPLQDQADWLIQKTVSTSSRLADSANALGLWPLANHWRVRIGGPLVGSLAILIGIWVVAHRRGPWGSWRLFLLGYSALHAAYYTLFARPDVRYLIPVILAIVLLSAQALDYLVRVRGVSRPRRVVMGCAISLFFANSWLSGVDAWHKKQGAATTHAVHRNLYDAARWLREEVPSDVVVGAWNAGILAYFSGHTVVNLDGVINDDVIPYLERAELSDYLDIRGITLLVDTDNQVPAFMSPFSGRANWRENYELIHREGRVVVLQKRH